MKLPVGDYQMTKAGQYSDSWLKNHSSNTAAICALVNRVKVFQSG
jgi:hypothetical protein